MRVAIIGTGYVGLVTGACLAHLGHTIVCVDSNPARVAAIESGECPIHEDGLPQLLKDGLRRGLLRATSDLESAIDSCEISMLCVGTPSADDGSADLGPLLAAARQVGEALRGRKDFHVVAVKSTVVPGTTDTLVRETIEHNSGRRVGDTLGLAMNPEFLSQGSAIRDFMEADRVIIGAADLRGQRALEDLYDAFDCPILTTSLRNAEMIKYGANALQATLISFANQIAGICEHAPGTDEAVIMTGLHLDRNLTARDGAPCGATKFLRGGIGFGGSCFPKDLEAFRHFARGIGAPTEMLDAVIATNRRRPADIAGLLDRLLGGLNGARIAVLGLAFKPGTDDLRCSPGITLAAELLARGAEVRCHDPLPAALAQASDVLAQRNLTDITLSDRLDQVLADADGAVIATAWPYYRDVDWRRAALTMAAPVILDGRDLLRGLPPQAGLVIQPIGIAAPANRPSHIATNGETIR